MSYKPSLTKQTAFEEDIVGRRSGQFNFKPTWGASAFRWDTSDTSGTGASVDENNGEMRLQSGTDNNGIASMRTKDRGSYIAGNQGQAGIGIRIPTLPTGTEFMEWGYTDWSNGFYFGVDATDWYVAYAQGGSVTKVYQSSWNGDPLDGAGASGLSLDGTDGNIFQIDFVWYGYGSISWSVLVWDATKLEFTKHVVHTVKINDALSTYDPNMPLACRVDNGASGVTSRAIYVGGHQFSTVGADKVQEFRTVSELVTNYTTATNTSWQPLVAFRKKATVAGRNNSINVRLLNFQVAADNEMEVRVTFQGTTSNLAWGAPTGRTAAETACETKVTGGTPLATSADGEPTEYGFVTSTSKQNSETTEILTDLTPIGETDEVILWIRRLSASGAMIVKHAHITWIEGW